MAGAFQQVTPADRPRLQRLSFYVSGYKMVNMIFEYIKGSWGSILGWTIFVSLFIAMLTDYYIFNPFLFGFAYYVLYVLSKFKDMRKESGMDIYSQRLLLICGISLLYMWFSLENEVNKKQFIHKFEKACYGGVGRDIKPVKRLCEEIESDINSYLYKSRDRVQTGSGLGPNRSGRDL